ncbi:MULTISPECIES: TIGR00266 family protein [Halorussus]|uniref:TIGR00266 family protein n=1 Tax=Halorussus TaxID=1070314 RepID=UPI000E21622E|nr:MULTISPECIES: TIGR00266 family protein [Halorussus]NHN61173.1 TIGR00266 family protein [Halorussus sp. JP-T4]
MEFNIRKRPSSAILEVTLDDGERIDAEPGAMVSRTDAVETDTEVAGGEGVTGMLSRAISDEREMTANAFRATADGAQVLLAPDAPGDVTPIDLAETGRIKVQSGSTLAWTPDVEKSTAANEAGNFFSSGELTVLAMAGEGTAFLSAYGAVVSREVASDDPLVVDEDHLVAWTDGLDVSRERDGSIKSTLLGGEGFVTRFTGDGSVWLQTRDPLVFRRSAGGN